MTSETQTQVGSAARFRMFVICGLLAIGLGIVVSSGYTIQVEDGHVWREVAQKQRQRRLHVTPKRGTIHDRNGSAMAVTIEVPSVSMDAVELLRGVPKQRIPVVARDAANRIAAALELDPARIERRILDKRRFTWLKRRISIEESDGIRKLSSREAGDQRIQGLRVEGEGQRYYPRRELAGPLLGFVATDGDGKDGVELSLNSELEGNVARLEGLRDRSGRLIFSDAVEDEQALAGHEIFLSIDQGIQYAAERELASAARTYEAAGGSVVVIRPQTGEILALASWPGYNPNDFRQSEPGERRDRAITDRFEPGSTMKIFTVAAGLSEGFITPTQKMYCEKGRMAVDNIVIKDTHPSEWLTIAQVLAVSSNICAAKLGLGLGWEKLYESLRRFGFGQETGVPLPGESQGVLLPRNRPWVPVETAAASFGQGISVTNLQLAMATAAIANGGKLMEPILVKKVTTATGELLREATPRVRRQAVSLRVARTVTEMMVGVTEGHGTGTEAAIEGFQVAGKTATAQKADSRTGQYSLDKYIASFVGFVPARNPEVAIAVTLDEPMIEHAGGAVAAPVFRRVAEVALKYMGVTPRGTKTVDIEELATTADPAHATYAALRSASGQGPQVQEVVKSSATPGRDQVKIPDMTGWSVRQAINKSMQMGVQPRIVGSGLLARQAPPPGAILDRGQDLVLVFEPAS